MSMYSNQQQATTDSAAKEGSGAVSWRASLAAGLRGLSYAEQTDQLKPDRAQPGVNGTSGAKKPIEEIKGEAFIKGAGDKLDVDPNDVEQNQLGDCWLLAGLMAVAKANPQLIKDMIKPAGAGLWQVTFHFPKSGGGFEKKSAIVDAKVPVDRKGGDPMFAQTGDVEKGKKELWALLVEKAYALLQGGYGKISGSKAPSDHFAMELISGKKDSQLNPQTTDGDTILARLEKQMTAGKGATCWTVKDGHANAADADKHKPKIITNHGYALVGVDKAKKTVDLMNPWGRAWDLKGLPIADLKKFYRNIRMGG